MNLPQGICSKCHEDFMNCKCDSFHPNIIDPELYEVKSISYHMNLNELRALYRILEYHYISYEDQEAHNVVNKIAKILKENELDRTSSSVKK